MFVMTPKVSNFGAGKAAISFSYDFGTDSPMNVSVAQLNSLGSVASVNTSGLGVSSVGAIRAVKFSISFLNPTAIGTNDGDLYIVVPSTQEVTRIPYLLQPPGEYTNMYPVVSGCVPVATGVAPTLDFVKMALGNGSGTIGGILTATLYTFDMPAFISQGWDSSTV